MNDMLRTLFLNHPRLPEEIYAFCTTIPEYQEAVRAYEKMTEKVAGILGKELYFNFEESLCRYMSIEVKAYYLFGLGLRQEILDGMKDQL